MNQDEISKSIIEYVQQHNRPDLALLPEHISQGILDILIEDTRSMAKAAKKGRPTAGNYITVAVLLLRSKLQSTSKLQISESELRTNIARYTQTLYLENLRRQGLITNLKPELTIESILNDTSPFSYDLTELGKRVTKESLENDIDQKST